MARKRHTKAKYKKYYSLTYKTLTKYLLSINFTIIFEVSATTSRYTYLNELCELMFQDHLRSFRHIKHLTFHTQQL